MEKKEWLIIVLLLSNFLIPIALYQVLPEKIPLHWNAQNYVDSMGPKYMIFLIPLLTVLIYCFLFYLPHISVYKRNIMRFYENFGFTIRFAFVLLMTSIFYVVLLASLGFIFAVSQAVLLVLIPFLFYISYTIRFTKRNFFIGIRTPWTLASEKVWKKTHLLGSKLLMLSSLFLFIGVYDSNLILVSLLPLILSILFLVIYSFVLYKRVRK
ncbi:MAG: SdpI family protein [Candidatus Diapherotrites archaeon]|nr:SdpI family protein [Candidatus Diapherotrites archaeon]